MRFEFNGCEYEIAVWTPVTGTLGGVVAFDTETELIRPGHVPRYVLGQAYAGGRGVYLIQEVHLLAFLEAHRQSNIITHNAAFDLSVVEKATGFSFSSMINTDRIWDIGLLYRLWVLATEGGVPKKWGLAYVCAEVLQISVAKDEAARCNFGNYIDDNGLIDYAGISEPEIRYAAIDAIVTYQVFEKIMPEVYKLDPRQYLSHRIQIMGAVGLRAVEINGIGMDVERRTSLLTDIDHRLRVHLSMLERHGYVPGQKGINAVLQKHLKSIETRIGVKLPKTDKCGAISTTTEILSPYRGHSPLIAALLDYRETKKTRDFLADLDHSRVYPHFNTLVNTGRTSCRKPNLQNMPRAAGVRECFIPSPGHKFLIIDYAQIELSTLAQVCIDLYGASKMADLINQGVDLHRWFASVLLNKSIEEISEGERRRAKACNFGFPGGLGTTAFLAYAKATYGIGDMSIEQADQYRDHWLRAFPEMRTYLSDDALCRLKTMYEFRVARNLIGDWADEDMAAKMFMRIISGNLESTSGKPYAARILAWAFNDVLPAIRYDLRGITEGSPDLRRQILDRVFVKTRTGRIRAKTTYTESKNTPFQGLAADGAKIALFRLVDAGYQVTNFIHDEFLVELVDDDQIEDHAKQVEKIVINSMREVVPDVAVRASRSFCDRWHKG